MKTTDIPWLNRNSSFGLRRLAVSLPSQGGVEIGPWLEKYAAAIPPGSAIVELGCWLGAGTAHLALGAMQSGAEIHCFDRWRATREEVQKAAKFDVLIHEGEDLLPIMQANLSAFPVKICYNKCNLGSVEWKNGPVGLYVDDATKVEPLWLRAMSEFKPCFIPGKTILVLMDYFFYEKAGDNYAAQSRYMTKHQNEFEAIEGKIGGTTTAVFRYSGK